MQINVQSRGFGLTDSIRAQAERRVRFALGSRSNRVHDVFIRLGDDNGPRGGVDKRCTVKVRLSGMAPVIVAHQDTDLYAAIDAAADRAGHAVARRLKRASRNQRHAGATQRPSEDASREDTFQEDAD